MLKNLLTQAHSRPELVILALMVLVIAMLIVPLPPVVLDLLIAVNIVTALLVFMGSFYAVNILDLSTFPSILLITTLFRLALSISTSRMILLAADGGKIIATFGRFVIGDNLVVGLVVFSIVTIVQFLVITKGSERVAEVAARFSLDAMPGKQMSIDADLRAGVIDNEGVKARRSVLERESQLYGAFDGAMKFIKGDAIASIIVIFVNLIGGISVGMAQHGMSMSEALTTYTILSIGDGLVAQIPSLLISIGAGFVVTRVSGSGNNLGANIIGELFSNPFVLVVTTLLALAIGMLPGFPLIVFALIALALGALYLGKQSGKKAGGQGGLVAKMTGVLGRSIVEPPTDGPLEQLDIGNVIPETVPLMVMLPEAAKPIFEQEKVVEAFRRRAFVDMGLRLPNIQVVYSPQTDSCEMVVLINEIRAATFSVCFDRHRVVGSTQVLEGLSLDIVRLPDGAGADALWVLPSQVEALQRLEVATHSPIDDLYNRFLAVMLNNISEFFGVQEAKRLVDDMDKKYPDLVKEGYRHVSVQRMAEVFQRLLTEKISIRNMKLILESLAQWGAKEKDSILLVEHVRGALARYISHRFAIGGKLRVLLLSVDFEETVSKGIRQTSAGAFLNLQPAASDQLLDRLSLALTQAGLSQRDMVLLTSMEVRRFVKRLVESRFPELEVLSFGEVADSVAIDVLKTI
jgi:type III secretion protein V